MQSKREFSDSIKSRFLTFSVEISKLADSLPNRRSARVISNQLIRSASSSAANYRAACRARSKKEFFSKMCIVVEEADESLFWLEHLAASKLIVDQSHFNWLVKEGDELLRISATAKNSCY